MDQTNRPSVGPVCSGNWINPDGMGKVEAEIEMSFGEEGEKYIINSPTTVYIPKGLVHCPLDFKRVDKPVLFIHATLAPRYKK